jgi:purine-nucleoside phosphorylase
VTSDDLSAFARAQDSARAIRERMPFERPRLAFVLGSGLGSAMDLPLEAVIPYAEIPHFPISSVIGHAGELLFARPSGVPCAFLSGRVHMYEGYSPGQVVHAVRTMRVLGAEIVVLTNAAGGVNTSFRPGNLMLITDHLNLTGRNALIGPNEDEFGTRFPDMSAVYAPELQSVARAAAAAAAVTLVEGVYASILGPSFETPAEIRMFRSLGADAVGMSTVLEAIAAVHAGMQVLGISCITNMAAGILPRPLSHAEVIETTTAVRGDFAALLRGVIERLAATG